MIRTERLLLERPSEKDFEQYYGIFSKLENNLHNPKGAMDLENAKIAFANLLNHWNGYNFGMWRISEIKTPHIIIGFGGIDYRLYGDETKLNLGYRFDEKYWGKGYATELAKSAIHFAFETLGKTEVYAFVRPLNSASVRVLEKSGMLHTGLLDNVPNEEKSRVFKLERKRYYG